MSTGGNEHFRSELITLFADKLGKLIPAIEAEDSEWRWCYLKWMELTLEAVQKELNLETALVLSLARSMLK